MKEVDAFYLLCTNTLLLFPSTANVFQYFFAGFKVNSKNYKIVGRSVIIYNTFPIFTLW